MSAPRSRPAASVVIPVLNAAAYLPALLRRLSAQKPAAPAEIILVDSMSTDATAEIAASWPGVVRISIANFTHGRSRNVGARVAKGEVVVLLSQPRIASCF